MRLVGAAPVGNARHLTLSYLFSATGMWITSRGRRVTVDEAMRIQSPPTHRNIIENDNGMRVMIGNSMSALAVRTILVDLAMHQTN